MVEDRFQDGARVVERKTNAERKQAREQQYFSHPCSRMQFALRANVKHRHRNGRRKKNWDVDQQRPHPPVLRSTGRRMQENAQAGEQEVSKV